MWISFPTTSGRMCRSRFANPRLHSSGRQIVCGPSWITDRKTILNQKILGNGNMSTFSKKYESRADNILVFHARKRSAIELTRSFVNSLVNQLAVIVGHCDLRSDDLKQPECLHGSRERGRR